MREILFNDDGTVAEVVDDGQPDPVEPDPAVTVPLSAITTALDSLGPPDGDPTANAVRAFLSALVPPT